MKLLLVMATLTTALMGQVMTSEERAHAVQALERTRDLMLKSTENVSAEKAGFKESEERWSVLQCAEHLALTERGVFMLILQATRGAEAPQELRNSVAGKTAMIEKVLPDRSRKATAPKEVAPAGKFQTLDEARETFKAARLKTIAFVVKTDLPLHSFVMKHPALGDMDAYQWILFLSGHAERHTLQIDEVKAAMAK